MAERQTSSRSSFSSTDELDGRASFVELFQRSPIPPEEQLGNLGLFIDRQTLSRLLFMHEVYRHILDVPGVVMEFGTRWGQNLALFESFRGIYEPFNYTRKLIGFDTFEGFPSIHARDGASDAVSEGGLSVTEGYVDYLAQVLDHHEQESPISHVAKYELVKGDVTATVPDYFAAHPETIVALAYFDLDLYEPTRDCLEAIRPRLVKGSVIGFDELGHPDYPGETAALAEVLGLDRYRLVRTPLVPFPSYLVVE